MPFVPVDKPALRGNDALSCAKNGDACRQLLGRRLQPTLLKSKARSRRALYQFDPSTTRGLLPALKC